MKGGIFGLVQFSVSITVQDGQNETIVIWKIE